jgi:hypothetical protein
MTEHEINREIARELLLEINIEADDALIDGIMDISSNPWDAPILYTMMQFKETK